MAKTSLVANRQSRAHSFGFLILPQHFSIASASTRSTMAKLQLDEAIEHLRANDRSLTQLYLCGDRFGDAEGAIAFANALNDNTALTTLTLGGYNETGEEADRYEGFLRIGVRDRKVCKQIGDALGRNGKETNFDDAIRYVDSDRHDDGEEEPCGDY